jgi:hypothetical protein
MKKGDVAYAPAVFSGTHDECSWCVDRVGSAVQHSGLRFPWTWVETIVPLLQEKHQDLFVKLYRIFRY